MAATHVITGAAGFIGSHLARALLARGERVVGIDSFDPFYARALKEANVADLLPSGRFDLLEIDIRDGAAIAAAVGDAEPTVIHHLAALAGVRPSLREPARFVSVNMDGLVSVLEAARAVGCRNVLFASSSSVYGNNEKVPFAETDDVSRPISPYAATKRSGELLCHAYSHLFGLSIAMLRFFTVYGPGQRPDLAISRFFRLIAEDEEVPRYGDGGSSRDYTYVDDVIAGVLAASEVVTGEADGFCRIYNLGGARPLALSELIERVGRLVGRAPRIRPMPMQPGDVGRTWADLARSADELGYRPATDIDTGLARQWAWMESVMDRLKAADRAPGS